MISFLKAALASFTLSLYACGLNAQIIELDSLGKKVINVTGDLVKSIPVNELDSLGNKVGTFAEYIWFRDHDSLYIEDYSGQVALKLLLANKHTFFRLNDKERNSFLTYRPEIALNLGLGVTYKWFSFDIAFDFGLRERTIPDASFIDIQGIVFTTRLLIETTFQYFFGYQINGTEGFDRGDILDAEIRPDARTLNFVLQGLFALNHERFSLKAPFVFSERQKKSAGSPVFGAGFSIFTLDADSSLVPSGIADQFNPDLHLTSFNAQSLSLSAGYMHTFVWKKHWFLNVGVIPGMGFSFGDFQTEFTSRRKLHITYLIKVAGAVGYNGKKWFGGVQLLSDVNQERIGRRLPVIVGYGKSKFFVGYRFGTKK